MQATTILERARDTMTVKRVFGEPFKDGDVTILPVARVSGGAGAGSGADDDGAGGGFGMAASALGVFEIRNGEATWKPAVDINRVILGGQAFGIVLLLVIRSIIKMRLRHAEAMNGVEFG